MKNPWKDIDLDDYENHMRLERVYQLQAMNAMMKEQFDAFPASTAMILGIAGGNGLEHIDKQAFSRVYGVDINESYLNACVLRYPALQGVLETICTDLTKEPAALPHADLLVANLLIEYVGIACFQRTVQCVNPCYVSCIIQVDTDPTFVSPSPYLHAFDRLDEIHRQIEESELIDAMREIGYRKLLSQEREMPNGKKLVRIDFAC